MRSDSEKRTANEDHKQDRNSFFIPVYPACVTRRASWTYRSRLSIAVRTDSGAGRTGDRGEDAEPLDRKMIKQVDADQDLVKIIPRDVRFPDVAPIRGPRWRIRHFPDESGPHRVIEAATELAGRSAVLANPQHAPGKA